MIGIKLPNEQVFRQCHEALRGTPAYQNDDILLSSDVPGEFWICLSADCGNNNLLTLEVSGVNGLKAE